MSRTRFSAPSNVKVDELIAAYDGIIPEVEAIMQQQGLTTVLPVPECPDGIEEFLVFAGNGDPVLPNDLTLLEGPNLGKLFSYFTNYANYTQGLLTEAQVARDLFKEKLGDMEKALIITYQETNEGLSDAKAKAKLRLDDRYKAAALAYRKAVSLYLQLQTKLEQFKRSEKLISREQSRRSDELEALRHDQGGARGKPGRTPFRPGRFRG
tara:strand:+ start:1302 stop:1931 length:630 start_codon:yes stop_codon:yes gene_type:complete